MQFDEEKNCRSCEIILALFLLAPLITFGIFIYIKNDPVFWEFISAIVGAPLALLGLWLLLASEASREIGFFHPYALYFFGIVCVAVPTLSHHNYGAIAIGAMLFSLARKRQIIRARLNADSV
jgi:hypothetical protein